MQKTTQIYLEGWRPYPLIIEYKVQNFGYSGLKGLFWNIKDNNHQFNEQLNVIYENYGSNYNQYFTDILIMFRKDFLQWQEQGFPEEWMKNYYKNFYKNIIS